MRKRKGEHTFAVCAYKESPYLEECLRSLKKQTVPSHIIIATSTPNEHIDHLARKYEVPVYINRGEHGITQDWNFAYAQADTDYVTIAHQDDTYSRYYAERMWQYVGRARRPLIFFTDYAEIREGEIIASNRLLRIKRMMLLPVLPRISWGNKWIRRRVLSLGSPICCPSVTFAKRNLPEPVFEDHFRADEDWEAWERISRLDGEFIFCKEILTDHRIHEDSETTKILQNSQRTKEDLEMFKKFWPEPLARMLTKIYRNSEKSNEL